MPVFLSPAAAPPASVRPERPPASWLARTRTRLRGLVVLDFRELDGLSLGEPAEFEARLALVERGPHRASRAR